MGILILLNDLEEISMTMNGLEIINDPFLNKGSAFTKEERENLNLKGILPTQVRTMDQQVFQSYQEFKSKKTELEKRLFLMNVFNRNRTLFYKLLSEHLEEFLPIIYDPVIAQSIKEYNEIYSRPQDAAFISINDTENIEQQLKNVTNGRDIELIVATDGEGILGIGDWGINGVDIAIGKLMVYTAAAGIDPSKVLPVSLDVGTNNEKLLNDKLYLGNRHKRVRGEKYDLFIDQFVKSVTNIFPNVLLHWEDFGRDNATKILNKYKNHILTFNDDVQGTGIVTLAGILGALNISKEKLTDQTFMIYGAGTAGMGIANIILDEVIREGMSEQEAREKFYFVDQKGLLNNATPNLSPEQAEFIKNTNNTEDIHLNKLEQIVGKVKPTVLIGTSTQPGAFSENVVKTMAKYTERPIIFPLSNPTELAEAKAEDLLQWTDGKALIGTGIPVKDIEYDGVTYQIGQANNALMYPGLGLGLVASHSKKLNQEILSQASHALGNIVDTTQPGAAVLPPVSKIQDFSRKIAVAVAQSVLNQGLNNKEYTNVEELIDNKIWNPIYRDISKLI